MRMQSIDTWSNAFICFVRVKADEGGEGWGQVAPYCADITAAVLHRQVAHWALGHDPLDTAGLGDLVLEREHKFPGS